MPRLPIPEEYESVIDGALVCSFSVRKPNGRISTHPMIPLYDRENGRIYVTSSILFSKKVEYVKRDGRVGILFYNRQWTGGKYDHEVLVQGDATVVEDDVHRGWERLLPIWSRKEPYIGAFLKQRVALPLFWERVMIEVRPRRVFAWREGNTASEPEEFVIEQ